MANLKYIEILGLHPDGINFIINNLYIDDI